MIFYFIVPSVLIVYVVSARANLLVALERIEPSVSSEDFVSNVMPEVIVEIVTLIAVPLVSVIVPEGIRTGLLFVVELLKYKSIAEVEVIVPCIDVVPLYKYKSFP